MRGKPSLQSRRHLKRLMWVERSACEHLQNGRSQSQALHLTRRLFDLFVRAEIVHLHQGSSGIIRAKVILSGLEHDGFIRILWMSMSLHNLVMICHDSLRMKAVLHCVKALAEDSEDEEYQLQQERIRSHRCCCW